MSIDIEEKLLRMDKKLESKWRYIFIHGVLVCGLPFWGIGFANRYFFHHDQHLIRNSIIGLPFALVLSFAYGYYQWLFPFWRTGWLHWVLKITHPEAK
ncbi:MAG: hypothetical protein ABIT76_15630 [Chthoniobacterales bacterium]